MKLQFKKQSWYDTTPGTITFNTFTSQIGVGTENGVVTMGGGDISKLSWSDSPTAGNRANLQAGDIAIASEFSSNRFVLYDPAKIDIEYSRDNGSTWLDYGATDTEKFNLCSIKGNSIFYLGKWTSGETFNPSWQLRITFNNPMGDTEIYTILKMIAINASISGSVTGRKVICRGYDANDQIIQTYIDSDWNGYSGWNTYYPKSITFGGAQPSQCFKLEFTFSVESYSGSNAPQIINIFAYGTNLWISKNNLISWGHLYSIDENKSAVFPSSLYAHNVISPETKLLSNSEVDSKIENSWTWGEYD